MKRIGFYGGSFNPPHSGHQQSALHAAECANIDGLIVAPAYYHPEGKQLVDFEARVKMCWDTFGIFRIPGCPVWVDTVERRAFMQGGGGLTVNTAKIVLNEMQAQTMVLVVGSDIEVANWEGYFELAEMIRQGRVEIFSVHRAAEGAASSTRARQLIAASAPTDRLLPARVRSFIDEKGLYR